MKAKTLRMAQVIAIETDVKQRAKPAITKIHKATQKAELFDGSSATYEPASENEETYPPKKVKVRMVAEDALKEMAEIWVEFIDWTATKDIGNCSGDARADVVVDGMTLVEQAPVPLLLFLEKQVTDLRKAVEVIPTLSESEDWVFDEALGFHRTREPVRTHKTKTKKVGIVLHPPTKEHPAQTQLIDETRTVGYWVGQKFSGALTAPRKKQLVERVNKLLAAIKTAREEANTAKTATQNIGAKLFDFVLSQAEAS